MKILIVDDQPGLAWGLAQWLADSGWEMPGVATTAEEAIAWISEVGHVDVMVSDVVMQPTDGFTLRDTIQPHRPEMKTIFISGYDLSDYATQMAGATFLPKPVTGEALDHALRQLFPPKAAAPVVPAPVAVAAPQPSAKPVAVARPVAAVTVAPQAAAPKVAVPAVAQVATAAPKAGVPIVAAKAAVASAPKAAPAKLSAAGVEVELPPDALVGTIIGNYKIDAKIGEGATGSVYRATQTNIGRQVRLYMLDPELGKDPAQVESFIANASVKANVAHPYIFAVYEAGQAGGAYFYSCEYMPCRSLLQIVEAGQFLDEVTAVQAMKVASETLAYFYQNNIAHNLITSGTLLIAGNNKPRLANIAAYQPSSSYDQQQEMTEVGNIIVAALPESSQKLGIRQLAVDLATRAVTYPNWPALVQAVSACEPKVAPEDAYKLDAQERAAIRMVEETKKRQKRSMIISSAITLGLLCVALGAVYYVLIGSRSVGKVFNRMIEIPAGEFIYQNDEKVTLPTFYIDEYETTISQYAEFLAYLEKHPEEAKKFDSPDQPAGKSHVPDQWADGQLPGYYQRAKRWGKFHDAKLDVNSPVFGVDWFDAYAYAKWKGRRLPTEQEWEKAARGTQGLLYPWGNELEVKRVNSGVDTNADPAKGGEVDGWDRSSPVDAVKGDKSPYGIMDMAGNVSEWTGSWVDDPGMAGQKVVVIRGGNWGKPDVKTTRRVTDLSPLQNNEVLGFRTASDTPPAK